MDDKHQNTKKKLKIIGGILLVVGAILAVIGLANFFAAINGDGWPELFWMVFIGLPMSGIGGSIIAFAYKREISTYIKDESVPVINEAAEELSPAVRAVTRAVKDGVGGVRGSRGGSDITCKCGEVNPPDGKFCTRCGAPLLSACPHCGGTVDADDKFCGNCGKQIR